MGFGLNARIGVVVGMLIAGNLAISAIAWEKMGELNHSLSSVTGEAVPRMAESMGLRDIARRIALSEQVLISEGSRDSAERTVKELSEQEDGFLKSWERAYAMTSASGRDRLIKIKESFARWKEISRQMQSLALQGGQGAAAAMAQEKGKPALFELQGDIAQLVFHNTQLMHEETERMDVEFARTQGVLMFVAACTILFGAALAFFFLRSISHSVNLVIDQLNANAGKMALAAQQIAYASESLNQSSDSQASSLQQATASVREVNAAVHKNAESSRRSCELSLFSENAASKGKLVVEQMAHAIGEIHAANGNIMRQIEQGNRQVAEISKVIEEIGEKTKVINQIVFQTKLLSFNASAEASRAGDQGRGFAVVAEEIRSLAHTSGAAARDITLMLDAGAQRVDAIVAETSERVASIVAEANAKVEAGTRVAKQCREVLDEIVSNVSSVNHMALGISNASDEQARGMEKVACTVRELEEAASENRVMASDAARVSEELAREATALRGIVALLMRTIRGSGKRHKPSEPDQQREPQAKQAEAVLPERSVPVSSSAPSSAVGASGEGVDSAKKGSQKQSA